MKLAAVLCSLVAVQLVYVQLVEAQEEPEVDEIAPYDVVKKGEGYEERYYAPSRWICHGGSLARPSMSKMQKSFFPLFFYISGNNEEGVEIPMTAPVTMIMKQDKVTTKWKSQMCFYLPEAYQRVTPQPSNSLVYIEDRPAMTVFVRETGGFLTRASQWKYQAMELKEALMNKEPADFTTYYMAGYDSPMKFENRRNEVWYMKEV